MKRKLAVLALVLLMVAGLTGCKTLKAIFTPWGAQEQTAEEVTAQIERYLAAHESIICMENGACLLEDDKRAMQQAVYLKMKEANQTKKALEEQLEAWSGQPARTPKPTLMLEIEARYSRQLDAIEKALEPYLGECKGCKGAKGGE